MRHHCRGVLSAFQEVGVSVPVIVRLEGTNQEKGRKMLDETDLEITSAADLNDGAQKAVAAAG